MMKSIYYMPKTQSKRYNPNPLITFLLPIFFLSILAYYYSNTHSTTPHSASPRIFYTTNTSRLPLLTTYCKSSTSTITQTDRSTNTMYNNSLASYLQANSTIIVTALINLDLAGLSSQLTRNGLGTIVFIAPYLFGLALMLIIWPFLLCCCVCQEDCPTKCCRDRNPNYSAVQLNLPTVFVVLLALVVISAAIPAMTNSTTFFDDFNCQISKFVDDFYHGNTTSDQAYFFTGVTTLRSQLTAVLAPKISALQSQITLLQDNSGTPLNTAKTYATTSLNSMKLMPNGVNYNPFVLSYNYPVQNSTASGSLNSLLADQIGTYGVSSTYLGTLYSYITLLLSNMTAITTAAGSITPHLTPADMGAQITITDGILAGVQSNLDTLTTQVTNILTLLTKIDSYNTQYSMIIYACLLSLSALTLLGILLVKCCNFISCRYCLYFCCLLSFLACLSAFLCAILLALLTPSLFYTCAYFSSAFNTPAQFSSMIGTVGASNYANISSYFSQCFGGTNDFITQVNPTLSSYIAELKTAVFNSYQYNFTDMTSNVDAQLLTMRTAINNYGLGHVPDFNVNSAQGTAEINFFNSIADKSYFSVGCPSSSFSTFYSDVWVPGLSSTYQTSVSCSGLTQVDSSTCSNGLVNPPCPTSSCLDTFSLLSYCYRASTTGSIVSDANTRYGTCTLFTDYLTNFLNNYVAPANANIGNTLADSADNSRLAGRFVAMTQAPVNNLKSYMNTNVQTLFQNVYGNITVTHNLSSIFDPTQGVITGLDCRLLAQDIQNAQNSLCILTFNRIYFTLVVMAIMSFALALQVCCLLCFTVRHYQHSLRFSPKVFDWRIPLEESTSSLQMS